MNCFHFSVSLGYKTTYNPITKEYYKLWIAFIFQYLWDTKQPIRMGSSIKNRCELLSFFSIFGIQNNFQCKKIVLQIVVNCFHFSVSLGYKTTDSASIVACLKLWIAFIFQYLWDTKQLWALFLTIQHCCELLSFFSIFGIQNNRPICML